MKRYGNLYNTMLTQERMEEVFKGVMKDKKGKSDPVSDTFRIMNNKEYYMKEACRILYERKFKPKKPRLIIRIDKGSGKLREIKAPALWPDQFIHWSVVLALKPVFMKGMDKYCCASIKFRGPLYAKDYISKKLDDSLDYKKPHSRKARVKYKYCLKMDIRKFFDNIDRDILMHKLNRKIKDKEILDLCRIIIYSVPGKGLPLGYFTSQWFANFFLQDLDHYVREKILPKYKTDTYVRYMDDMIVLGSNKRHLAKIKAEITEYLINEKLELKEESPILDIAERKIDFVGYMFSYGKVELRRKLIDRIRAADTRLHRGKYSETKLHSMLSYYGFIKYSDMKQYFKRNLKGDIFIEKEKLSSLVKKRMKEELISGKSLIPVKIAERMFETKAEDDYDNVLVRYYPDKDEVRIVSRTHFEYPPLEELGLIKESNELDKLDSLED